MSEQKQTPNKPKKEQVSAEMYENYIKLKFIKLTGDQLREDYEKELEALESKIKACSGNKPKKTTTRQLGVKLVRLVEGIPVPDLLYNYVKANCKNISKYF